MIGYSRIVYNHAMRFYVAFFDDVVHNKAEEE